MPQRPIYTAKLIKTVLLSEQLGRPLTVYQVRQADAQRRQQVLVKLEPDRVVAVDFRTAHEVVLARERLVVRGIESLPVRIPS